MFTGIVAAVGRITAVEEIDRQNYAYTIQGPTGFFDDSRLGDSIMVAGVCLSIVDKSDQQARFEIMAPTIAQTTFGNLAVGDQVNLEKSLPLTGRLDGHFVLGHVDGRGKIISQKKVGQTVELEIEVEDENLWPYLVSKGSVALDGTSLTIVRVDGPVLTIGLIPITQANTTFGTKQVGDFVNVETDILAKYSQRQETLHV
ncbi:Riboflavin synthase alpha chain (RibC) [Fructobacillus cardui]|uniref:riboflavin synthase n=1 Tax=Fructobacillus cardui TaxID=2893170 RepID=UPI002DAA660A|nr:Riboflavin synthase alpha chain (RibC) [Fructobacillus cardui]